MAEIPFDGSSNYEFGFEGAHEITWPELGGHGLEFGHELVSETDSDSDTRFSETSDTDSDTRFS